MKYDLLIRDGEVVDPGGGLRGRMDVGIAGGNFEFRDTDGNAVDGKRRLITHLTLKDGRVCYERPSE